MPSDLDRIAQAWYGAFVRLVPGGERFSMEQGRGVLDELLQRGVIRVGEQGEERIARELYLSLCDVGLVNEPGSWEALLDISRHYYRSVVRSLLRTGVIQVGEGTDA